MRTSPRRTIPKYKICTSADGGQRTAPLATTRSTPDMTLYRPDRRPTSELDGCDRGQLHQVSPAHARVLLLDRLQELDAGHEACVGPVHHLRLEAERPRRSTLPVSAHNSSGRQMLVHHGVCAVHCACGDMQYRRRLRFIPTAWYRSGRCATALAGRWALSGSLLMRPPNLSSEENARQYTAVELLWALAQRTKLVHQPSRDDSWTHVGCSGCATSGPLP